MTPLYFGFVILLLFFKKETQMLLDSNDIDNNEINRIDIVVDGDYGQ